MCSGKVRVSFCRVTLHLYLTRCASFLKDLHIGFIFYSHPFTYCCCCYAHFAQGMPEDAPIVDVECIQSIGGTIPNIDGLMSNGRSGYSSFRKGGAPAPNQGAIICSQGIDLNGRIPTSTYEESAVHRCERQDPTSTNTPD